MSDETDAELVAGLRRGNREAAGRLAERYLRGCRAVALAIVGDVASAEDVAQDAFVRAIERIDDCTSPDRFAQWLLQIVRNASRNHVRDRRADRHVALGDVALTSRTPSPLAEAELAELRVRLLAALAVLKPAHREIVLLHDLEGWTHREIADRLGLPSGTVRSHLHHARRALRDVLGGTKEGGEQ